MNSGSCLRGLCEGWIGRWVGSRAMEDLLTYLLINPLLPGSPLPIPNNKKNRYHLPRSLPGIQTELIA